MTPGPRRVQSTHALTTLINDHWTSCRPCGQDLKIADDEFPFDNEFVLDNVSNAFAFDNVFAFNNADDAFTFDHAFVFKI